MTGVSALNRHCTVLKVHLLFGKEKIVTFFEVRFSFVNHLLFLVCEV